MRRLYVSLVVAASAARAAADPSWLAGDHASGDWGGVRDTLADHGVAFDLIYSAEAFADIGHGGTALGHVDGSLTLDTQKLGLWPGGTLYALGQNNHGSGISDRVGSAAPVSNLDVADPYTQLTELFYEQHAFDDTLSIRIGKQDANRDFGTPRFGGNFLNANSGMFPNSALPSYPTTGLGALVAVRVTAWLTARTGIYEGSPSFGGFGLDTAFAPGAGTIAAAGLAATRHGGLGQRDDGTTSVGLWHATGAFDEIGAAMPRTFATNDGFFVQHDEHLYANPDDPKDATGLNVILRFSWARSDRNAISRYAGGTAAWHGLGMRNDDTIGIGVGYLALGAHRDELYVELTYKWRITKFVSLQPDVELYRHPGGDGRDAFLAGGRIKLKL